MLVNDNAITINITMREARSVGAAKILCLRQESSVNLTPFGGGSAAWQYQYLNISFSYRYRTNFLAEIISCNEVIVISSSEFNSKVKFLPGWEPLYYSDADQKHITSILSGVKRNANRTLHRIIREQRPTAARLLFHNKTSNL